MTRHRRTDLRLWAVAGAALLSLTTGCSNDTSGSNETALGAIERTQNVTALNLVLVTEGEGVARLVGTVINKAQETDRLVGIDVDAEMDPSSLIFAESPLPLPTDLPLKLAREAEVTVVSDQLRPGRMATLTFQFENSDPLVSQVPVRLREGPYSEVEIIQPPDGDIAPDS